LRILSETKWQIFDLVNIFYFRNNVQQKVFLFLLNIFNNFKRVLQLLQDVSINLLFCSFETTSKNWSLQLSFVNNLLHKDSFQPCKTKVTKCFSKNFQLVCLLNPLFLVQSIFCQWFRSFSRNKLIKCFTCCLLVEEKPKCFILFSFKAVN